MLICIVIRQSLGRTTFVNTLCGKKVLLSKDSDDSANAHVEEGVRIKPVTVGTCFFRGDWSIVFA